MRVRKCSGKRKMQGSKKYNSYCTSWGCYEGILRDDIDNGWPSWQWPVIAGNCTADAANNAGLSHGCPGSDAVQRETGAQCSCPFPGTGFVGTPHVSPQGQLRAPPLWHYTVPQSAADVAAMCGPAGCGPPQPQFSSSFTQGSLPIIMK